MKKHFLQLNARSCSFTEIQVLRKNVESNYSRKSGKETKKKHGGECAKALNHNSSQNESLHSISRLNFYFGKVPFISPITHGCATFVCKS